VVGYVPRWFTSLQAVTHPSSMLCDFIYVTRIVIMDEFCECYNLHVSGGLTCASQECVCVRGCMCVCESFAND